ncbi:hypothetical protein K503DRAFT_783126 [Rhizopogon vinicolor AM-OR11-026]|uniref:Uncharacterized protein n=1 Tax=Rhizopogon vinicolor AM-OR11-026 TaxID=1314800 RepID=A0A1B7MZX2_9AGAM|nr:hypothetical protein K503DRAFT_783126 [Rhizopogon vinicolor AM-OR11-026]
MTSESLVVSRAMNLSTHLESSRLAKDLEDSRKTCLSVPSLHHSLHIAAIVGASRQLGVVVFAILHAIPAVGIFAVTSAQLAFTLCRSPSRNYQGKWYLKLDDVSSLYAKIPRNVPITVNEGR